jgi:hypothetical protein
MISEFCDWLSATGISIAFQSSTWFVPMVQTVHILNVAVLLTAVFVMSLRLIGFKTGRQPVAELIGKSLTPIWISLGVLLLTGILLTITEPARELLNWAFRAKMILVLVLAVLLGVLQSRNRHPTTFRRETSGGDASARFMGVALLLIGTAIVTAGRWIAYVV